MLRLRLIFLVFVLVATPGYRFRCWWGCTDQTAIQHDYVEHRDHCRAYAQLKLDMVMRNKGLNGPDARRTQLVNLFSECMSTKGWDIPSGRAVEDGGTPPLEQAALAPALAKTDSITNAQEKKWALTRSSECAFARHAAAYSSISAARAKACDLECEQRLKSSPDAPRPAACPSAGPDSRYATGVEREYDPEN